MKKTLIAALFLVPSFVWGWMMPCLVAPRSVSTRSAALSSIGTTTHLHAQKKNDAMNSRPDSATTTSRRWFAKQLGILLGASTTMTVAGALSPSSIGGQTSVANAAPPIAVIAEELGYFPVTNSENETVYVPKRIKRESSEQAIQLARKLRETGAVVYTAYWCPHCARQKELFGREAWKELRNVECAPKGYNAQPGICLAKQVDGYPTMILGNGKRISGERSLSEIAKEIGFKGFREDLETNLPASLGSSACR